MGRPGYNASPVPSCPVCNVEKLGRGRAGGWGSVMRPVSYPRSSRDVNFVPERHHIKLGKAWVHGKG